MSKYIIIFLVLFLTGCADNIQFNNPTNIELVGFFYGLWHGIIIIFSFFSSLFFDDVAIYAAYNNGSWYDFGYIIGVVFHIRFSIKLTN